MTVSARRWGGDAFWDSSEASMIFSAYLSRVSIVSYSFSAISFIAIWKWLISFASCRFDQKSWPTRREQIFCGALCRQKSPDFNIGSKSQSEVHGQIKAMNRLYGIAFIIYGCIMNKPRCHRYFGISLKRAIFIDLRRIETEWCASRNTFIIPYRRVICPHASQRKTSPANKADDGQKSATDIGKWNANFRHRHTLRIPLR